MPFGRKKGGHFTSGDVIRTCIELIRTFNPVTHSIDTHCSENLGDVSGPVRLKNGNVKKKYKLPLRHLFSVFVPGCQRGEYHDSTDCVWVAKGESCPQSQLHFLVTVRVQTF